MSGPCAERRAELVAQILSNVDPRCRAQVDVPALPLWPAPRQRLVLVGHRAAGKSRLLPLIAELSDRKPLDLDQLLAERSGGSLREWIQRDMASFRAAERKLFSELEDEACISVGGGFLSLHPELLAGSFPLLVPVAFETYRQRLLEDLTRPRLHPELSAEEELATVFRERELAHARVPTVALSSFLSAVPRASPRRVVTLSPEAKGREVAFARNAKIAGAALLEVRSDLHGAEDVPLERVREELPLLVAERGRPLSEREFANAAVIDREGPFESLSKASPAALVSFHAPAPLAISEALAHWEGVAEDVLLKHVEPLGRPSEGVRLLELQAALQRKYGRERVTVLATGPLASPFRAVLATNNALDYVAFDGEWAAAPGQRLLPDAVRSDRALGLRRAILGSAIAHSRSPRIHPPPFDRIDLPADAPVGELVDALWPWYSGFAVTSPFKKALALHVKAEVEAINTLVRTQQGWRGFNTDVEGARAAMERLGGKFLTVLGDGGAAVALRAAAHGRTLTVLRRDSIDAKPLRGELVWTWPESVSPPPSLRFQDARVGVIAYGRPGKRIAEEIRRRGGDPVPLGACWLIAQARRQRALWENAR